MNRHFTPRQVAASLGVSESSLKRWCDRGELQFERTPGGHRRLTLEGVVQFLRREARPLERPELLGLPQQLARAPALAATASKSVIAPHVALQAALSEGDYETGRAVVFERYLRGESVADLCDRLFALALHAIGEGWEHGRLDVYQEHRAVQLVERLLHEIRGTLPPPASDSPIGIGCSIDGDPYAIPTRMVELTLLEQGWRATSLGTSVPWGSLVRAAHAVQPRVLWLSASVVVDDECFVRDFNEFQQQLPDQTALVIGGRGLRSRVRRRLRYAAFCDSLSQFETFAQTVYAPKHGSGARPTDTRTQGE